VPRGVLSLRAACCQPTKASSGGKVSIVVEGIHIAHRARKCADAARIRKSARADGSKSFSRFPNQLSQFHTRSWAHAAGSAERLGSVVYVRLARDTIGPEPSSLAHLFPTCVSEYAPSGESDAHSIS
jgi:hypothetical protein